MSHTLPGRPDTAVFRAEQRRLVGSGGRRPSLITVLILSLGAGAIAILVGHALGPDARAGGLVWLLPLAVVTHVAGIVGAFAAAIGSSADERNGTAALTLTLAPRRAQTLIVRVAVSAWSITAIALVVNLVSLIAACIVFGLPPSEYLPALLLALVLAVVSVALVTATCVFLAIVARRLTVTILGSIALLGGIPLALGMVIALPFLPRVVQELARFAAEGFPLTLFSRLAWSTTFAAPPWDSIGIGAGGLVLWTAALGCAALVIVRRRDYSA